MIHQYNMMAPTLRLTVEMLIDMEMQIYDQITNTVGVSEIDLIAQDLLESLSIIASIVFNNVMAICESNPQDLQHFALISKDLTKQVIEANSILLPTIEWTTGPMFDVMIPMMQTISTTLIGASIMVSPLSRSLLSTEIPIDDAFRRNMNMNGYEQDPLSNKFSDVGQMSSNYINELRKQFNHLDSLKDLNKMIDEAKEIRSHSQQIHFKSRSSYTKHPVQTEKQERIKLFSTLINNQTSTISKYMSPQSLAQHGTTFMNWMGFDDIHHLNRHLKEEYGNGKGFVSSIDPHNSKLMKYLPLRRKEGSLSFSEYMTEMRLTPKDFASKKGNAQHSPTSRKLLQFIPLPPPLDCFTTIPADPFCFLSLFGITFPLDGPEFIDDFAEFDCDCDDYDTDDGYFSQNGAMNALTVLQTIISVFSSLPFINDLLMSVTLPAFIEDNLFITTPGDAPSTDEIICAILHLDYFLLYAIPALFLLFVLVSFLFTFWTCFKIYVELRVLNQHQKLVREILDADDLAAIYDIVFEREAPNSLFNKGVYCFGNPDAFDTGATYTTGKEFYKPLIYNGLNNLRIRKSCYDLKHSVPPKNNTNVLPLPNRPPTKIDIPKMVKSTTYSSVKLPTSCASKNKISTTLVQQELLYNAVTKVKPKASHEEIRKYYHWIYPEDYDYNTYSKKEIMNKAVRVLGRQEPHKLTYEDRVNCMKSSRKANVHHINTSYFQKLVNSRLKNTIQHIIVHK